MKTFQLLIVLVALSAACSVGFKLGDSAESNRNNQNSAVAATQAQSATAKINGDVTELPQSNLTGTYRYKSGRNNNAVGIEDLGGNRLRIVVAANYEYKDNTGEWMANSGSASGVAAKNGDTAVFSPEEYPDCKISLKFSGNKIIVKTNAVGLDCGFGGNVTADGIYTKTSDKINPNEMIDDEPQTPGKSVSDTSGERIRFKSGATSATVSGTAIGGAEKTYVLGAAAGQMMTVNITENSPNNDVVFHIVAPDGSFPMGTTGGEGADNQAEIGTSYNGKLPKTGDYKIIVGTIESKKANFKMLVSIR